MCGKAPDRVRCCSLYCAELNFRFRSWRSSRGSGEPGRTHIRTACAVAAPIRTKRVTFHRLSSRTGVRCHARVSVTFPTITPKMKTRRSQRNGYRVSMYPKLPSTRSLAQFHPLQLTNQPAMDTPEKDCCNLHKRESHFPIYPRDTRCHQADTLQAGTSSH